MSLERNKYSDGGRIPIDDHGSFHKVPKSVTPFFETLSHDKKPSKMGRELLRDDEIFIDSKEAAEILSVTKGALNNMVYRKQLVRHKLGRRNRFLLSDIKTLIKK